MKTLSEAFAAQAASDLDAYYLLARSTLPTCHRLHYLQMWLEKLCKAHLWFRAGTADDLRSKHGVVEKILPQLIKSHWRKIGFTQPPQIEAIRALCREIDLLHPQISDNKARPDNVEYPWPDGSGNIQLPAQWKFPLAKRLESPPGRLLIKAAHALTCTPKLFTS